MLARLSVCSYVSTQYMCRTITSTRCQGRLESMARNGIFSWQFSGEVRDVDNVSLHAAGRADKVEVRRAERDLFHLGIRRFARGATAALRQGQEAAMGRRGTDRLVARSRPREPDDAGRPGHSDLWYRHLEPDDREGAPRGAPSSAGLADLAIHARRARCLDRHLQDRADRAGPRLQILC